MDLQMTHYWTLFVMIIFVLACLIAYRQVKLSNIRSMNEARAHSLIMERSQIDRMKPSDKQIQALKSWKAKVAQYAKDYENSSEFCDKQSSIKLVVNND
ncbi:hypothetical protein [Shewanella cutis]|uniref:Uncharacterized protein n=1 Tax=Shewanella cutis TaxID=2766780 RepID=A0ABS9QW79_9GAMM|nr:hypothetical protein [Shewanella sp. PS-2]MCG9964595.1 hypothetical protein [Shewanella sp. PS-2]